MSQKIKFYPLGNAETCLLELGNGEKLLFDYADVYSGKSDDARYDIKSELSDIKSFKVVMFSHPHDDHTKGASEFFFLDHHQKYQSSERAKIEELWVSAAFILDTELEPGSDAKILRQEARHRLKNGYGIKVFAATDGLKEWLDDQGVDFESVKHLIVHAGETVNTEELGEEIQVFVHAPFSDDCDDVQDKNDPSIVMQIRLFNGNRETNIIMTGDVTYKVLDRIVDISKEHGNEEYLSWDIYDIPHHCSYSALNGEKEKGERIIEPTENIKWLLGQHSAGAKMIASCDKITETTSPPHIIAKRAYEKYGCGKVLATMENKKLNDVSPSPIEIKIDELGVTKTEMNEQFHYFKKSAPRAG